MRDHRVRVEEQYYVGHGSMSPEASGNTNYICRAAPVSDTLLSYHEIHVSSELKPDSVVLHT